MTTKTKSRKYAIKIKPPSSPKNPLVMRYEIRTNPPSPKTIIPRKNISLLFTKNSPKLDSIALKNYHILT